MRKSYRFLTALFIVTLFSMSAMAQSITIAGNVKNGSTKENVAAVSVTIKNTATGVFTDDKGNFKFSTAQKPPFTLIISSVGFETQEITVSGADDKILVELNPVSTLGVEVVVAASRTPQRILESPVSIERMSNSAIRNAATPNYYEAIANLKGVDMITSSLTFRTVSTRGFNGSGNLRLNQLIDGMDNQAPGLNFSVGSVIGITELDVDNVELLSGASSALYGTGGMNGTLLINSKNPFKYQGLSVQIKQGVMHTDKRQRAAAPYYDWNIRWAKAFNNRFAFKFSSQFIQARDWQAQDRRNVARSNINSKIVGGDRLSDPNYDGVNVYGDETTVNIRDIVRSVFSSNPSAPTLFGVPTAFALANTPDQLVSRTGYDESQLVDYNTVNLKLTGGLYYKITPGIEASLVSFWGTGTTVYTGSDRYSLRNLVMAQHKAEIKSKNWFVRAYTTQENAGDSYNATVVGRLINEAWKPSANFATPVTAAGSWYPQYIGNYLGYKFNFANAPGGPNDYLAHNFARGQADAGRLLPGTARFNAVRDSIRKLPIPRGGKFLDKTDLWASEAQLNLSDALKFSDKIEIIAGASWRQFSLNSEGTLFLDTAGRIKINEFGGYVQFRKKLFEERLTLTASGRFDKNDNFEGRFTPRVTALIKLFKDNNLRLSYQTGYRFPSTQNQYINLNTGSAKLIGGLPLFADFYKFSSNPIYTAESIDAVRTKFKNTLVFDPTLLKVAQFNPIKPESVVSYEIGYKGIIAKRVLIDVYGYMSDYTDFIGAVAAGQARAGGAANLPDLINPLNTSNYSFPQNSSKKVKARGYGMSVEVLLPRNFVLSGNFSSDELYDVEAGLVTFFSTPRFRYNISLGNPKLFKNFGFSSTFRWQDNNFYEGTFVTGTLPYFGVIDAQFNLRLPKISSVLKIGGSNIGNFYYRTAFGNPEVGGLYYVSYGYNL
jgi:outer membrane receptor protein involved in Fe transport